MKVKALWGFIGNAKRLGADSAKVVAGQVFEKIDPEYGHTLVGKGLVEEIADEGKSKASKPAAPKTSKPAAPKETKPIAPASDTPAATTEGVIQPATSSTESGAAATETPAAGTE